MLWEQALGGSGEEIAYDIAQTADGGYVVVGGSGTSSNIRVALLDAGGKSVADVHSIVGRLAEAYAVQPTTDGGYICAGYSRSSSATDSLYLVKLDSSTRKKIWERNYGTQYGVAGYSLQPTSDGGYIILGTTEGSIVGTRDFYLLKVDADGNMQWSKTYGGDRDDLGRSVRQTSDGGYVLFGTTTFFSAERSGTDMYLVKVDAEGRQEQ